MTKNRVAPASGTGPTFVRIAEDDHDGPAVTVDGRPVPVPAEGDPVALALGAVAEQARRHGSGVRVVVVDDRDGWEHRLVVRPDGEVDEDAPAADRAPRRREWRRIVAAVAGVVLLVVGAWAAARSRPAPGPAPAGVMALGAGPLPSPIRPPATPTATATTTPTALAPRPPPPSSSAGPTAAPAAGRRTIATRSRTAARPQPSRPSPPTSRRAATADRLAATPTRPPATPSSDAGSSGRGQSDFGGPAVTATPVDPGSAGRPQSGG